jgi:tetratricopeptide (TPR) repeat protein
MPKDPDLLFYLAELYHRRGDLERADAAYQQVLTVDPQYGQAHLRLGMLAEASCGSQGPSCAGLREATEWYGRYFDLVPEDVLALKRLTEVCTTLEQGGLENESCREAAEQFSRARHQIPESGNNGDSESGEFEAETSYAAVLSEVLAALTDDRKIVAELLGLPVEDIALGPNLLENGGFEEWVDGKPTAWRWAAWFSRAPFETAAFIGGADGLSSVEGRLTARVDGLWVRREEGRSTARAGYRQWDEGERALRSIPLTADTPYVFSVCYRTSRLRDGAARIWVSPDLDILWSYDHRLPVTDETWSRLVVIGWNRTESEAAIRPLFRSLAPGSWEVDQVQLRAVQLLGGSTVQPGETLFWVMGEED